MNVTLISCFRNAESYIDRYFDQIDHLADSIEMRGDCLNLIWGEGDSTDYTLLQLQRAVRWLNLATQIVDCTHGGPVFGSVVNEQRFRQLAHVGNCMWKAIPADADVVLYVESDLIWDAETMLRLIDDLQRVPAVAPVVMELSTGGFYDTFCFRKDGAQFKKYPPYHPGLTGGMVELDSAGSCVAMNADLARHLVWDERVFVGICQQIRELGGSLWLNPNLTIHHP